MTRTPASSGHPPVTAQPTPATLSPQGNSYFALRRAVGFLGILLPGLVWFIGWREGLDHQVYNSISAHYYSRARDVFVESMALIGTLVFFYQSPIHQENWVARITGTAGILIGILPMDPAQGMRHDMEYTLFEHLHSWPVGIFFAGGLYLVAVSFRRTTTIPVMKGEQLELAPPKPGPMKSRRDLYYAVCAAVMAVSLVLLILAKLNYWSGAWEFAPESVAVVSFAVAWLVKGQTWRGVYGK